ncbi:NAD(P)H-dependent oxidoreductase [Clostridium sp. P21]|uniref:NAD(P)H-dependent oxidoreductase n=1 Tax=Clostridium muellerianum TaxID=2716538 RepID=A0A7Y0EFT3_9CLOT|nr:NAD(P)H-dependent oxidoreductase [Clostridium muellerianum]NMM62660.1 NAD(P)H-dependent oxidoreductase [Clostridium muellerianum]
MEILYVVSPNDDLSDRLKYMTENFIKNFDSVKYIKKFTPSLNLKNKKLLFLLQLDVNGFDLPMLNFLKELSCSDKNALENSTGALLVNSISELGTKRSTQDTIFIANNLGCRFLGHPIIEATKSLKNFINWQKNIDLSLEEICFKLSYNLGKRLSEYENPLSIIEIQKKITVLYSSTHKFSNTLDLWHMVSKHLNNFSIREIHIENGKILDCKGCSYKLCLHYGKQNKCFYGGFMVDNVLPAIEESDAVVWLCPNYNDAIAANLTAVINRITVLYNKISFYNKSMFGVIVSGNSGSDSVAKQLIGALNINKGFKLSPHAIITETANNPKSIFKVENIEFKAKDFAKHIITGV